MIEPAQHTNCRVRSRARSRRPCTNDADWIERTGVHRPVGRAIGTLALAGFSMPVRVPLRSKDEYTSGEDALPNGGGQKQKPVSDRPRRAQEQDGGEAVAGAGLEPATFRL